MLVLHLPYGPGKAFSFGSCEYGVGVMAGTSAFQRFMKYGQNLRAGLQQLWQAQDGNVMLVMALSILPILAAIGGAVDISRAYTEQARLH